jgi:hypothetical protein
MKLKHILSVLLLLLILPISIQAQYYDLSVGTERHFDNRGVGNTIFTCCFLIDTHVSAFERVIDEILINDTLWAVVEFEHYLLAYSPSAGGDIVYERRDTTLYRMDGPNLIERSDREDQVIFNFEWEVDDDVNDKLDGFLSSSAKFLLEQSEESSTIIQLDTTVTFPNGKDYRISWGDVTETSFYDGYSLPSASVFLNNILIEKFGMMLPIGRLEGDQYAPVIPFYQIEGIGAMYTFFNHRDLYMVGYKSSDGTQMGYTVTIPTSIEKKEGHPVTASLLLNYPNPFNPTTVISYRLSVFGELQIHVKNMLGQRITTLFDGIQTPGQHTVTFDAAGLPSGIYIVVLESEGMRDVRKVTLMK